MEKTPEQEDLNTSLIAVSGLIGAVIVFFGIVALQAWYYHAEKEEMYRKVIAPAAEELAAVTAEQQGQLNSYRLIDSQKQIVAIPIDRAMAIVVQDLAAGKTPLPIPVSQPAATSRPGS
ncbi:MAG TPA: hypothetical protein VMV94_19355 [Phycisphaerae bacterium]|nr:hypothetical protein [Phycisphaerae bacterium]